jgi:hypothetical protein
MEWTDDWPAVFKMECPDCGVLVEAVEIEEVDSRRKPKAA